MKPVLNYKEWSNFVFFLICVFNIVQKYILGCGKECIGYDKNQ